MKTTWRNPQKSHAKFEVKKKRPKSKQTSDLGGSWALFGKGLGGSGASIGRCETTFARLFGVLKFNGAFLKHGSKMNSKTPFGSILGRSWEDLGWIWVGFGATFWRIWTFLRRLWAASGRIWKNVALLWESLQIGPPR